MASKWKFVYYVQTLVKGRGSIYDTSAVDDSPSVPRIRHVGPEVDKVRDKNNYMSVWMRHETVKFDSDFFF